MRETIDLMKKSNNIVGRTIHVADKGLNCIQNIAFSKKNNDGYLFSKSVKTLSEKEQEWIFVDSDWNEVKDEHGKLLYKYKSCIDKFQYKFTQDGKNKKIDLTEKRLLTYNPQLAQKHKIEINKMIDKANSLIISRAKKCEYGESAKYVNFIDENGKKAKCTINTDLIEKDLKLAGYNLLVTSEIKMNDKDIYETYHNLWRIEESFRIMKSDLDARPVFLQKEETIKGHFLICYLTVLLERIFQFKILNNMYCSNDIFKFIKDFKILKSENSFINTTTASKFINDLSNIFNLPLNNYFLTKAQLTSIIGFKI